ncbi:18.1 kDa class I heat shock protein-like [Hibiscus syriacus]|uniref:18.1 kDa class I heat shock protein-like n=1 Tax=Hibiscus syriacus TaxID=106335 RepID=UPI00192378B6|nr:18.1 kDa class I heat shock protein-like [Hibiscus syriacus]
MGDVHGTRTAQELVPHVKWIEDSMAHYLLIHLPGFEKEDVMVGLAYPGYVTISGERIVNAEKSIYFGQALKLADNLDMNKIDQSFEGETLCLTFPKRIGKDENDQYHCRKAFTRSNQQWGKSKREIAMIQRMKNEAS